MIQTVPPESLVLDFNIYIRNRLDEVGIRRLGDVHDAGRKFDPVHADEESRRVCDGFHRTTFCQRRSLPIAVEFHRYADGDAIILDACRRNACHGIPLSPLDRARAINLATERGISSDEIAKALAMPVVSIDKIRESRRAYRHNGDPVPLKRSLSAWRGKHLTPAQEQANERASGWSAAFHAEQLINLIEVDVVDWTDARVIELMGRLIEMVRRHIG